VKLLIALARGSALSDTLDLLGRAGLSPASAGAPAGLLRQFADGSSALVTCATDVPLLVERGAADIGVVGKEVLAEAERDMYELLDLKIGRARLVFAQLAGTAACWSSGCRRSRVRVATRFPETTRRYFEGSGRQVEVVPLRGAVEAAPGLGLADAIVELENDGTTMMEAGLQVREVLAECSQRLITGRAAHALRATEIVELCRRLRSLGLSDGREVA
jgi:ATP phosphoribosyltransferase